MDNVIQVWLATTVEYQRVAHGRRVEAVGRFLEVFYADYGTVDSRDS